MKKRDVLLLAAILAAALVTAVVLHLTRATGDRAQVLVYVGNELYGAYPLDEPQAVVVEQPDGAYNRLVIADGAVHMEDANCKNHDCIRQGTLTPGGGDNEGWIVCLPNRVSVELRGTDG